MLRIVIFKNKEEFDKRRDKSVNGVTQSFLLLTGITFEDLNLVNCKGCWCCNNCIDCIDCRRCYNCLDCTNCERCYNCLDCTNCERCYNCGNCKDCKKVIKKFNPVKPSDF